MLRKEALQVGASPCCPECGVRMDLRVLRSAAGFYVGTECPCGPSTRESGYYARQEDAARALAQGAFCRG